MERAVDLACHSTCGGRAELVYNKGRHEELPIASSAAAVTARVGISGSVDHTVSAHGHCKLSCICLRCLRTEAQKGSDGIRHSACGKLSVVDSFLLAGDLSDSIYMDSCAVASYLYLHSHVPLYKEKCWKAYDTVFYLGLLRGLSQFRYLFIKLSNARFNVRGIKQTSSPSWNCLFILI